ncbi:MAG: 8-amino-7-oxononanoate synthase [Verrucomicrobia bacterium]|nr:8-amino-7-oxononanoate synthase [Verrucomicrobiota bacterium]
MTKPQAFTGELARRLSEIREAGLYRELRQVDSPQSHLLVIDGREYLNFSSNDYLGLANDSRLKEAAIQAIEKFGVGSGASRLISGSLAPLHELEASLAGFKNAERALTFSSGYATALGVIATLVAKDDIIVIDKLAHACIVDAARLSGAALRVFAHNDLNDLEDILKWADRRGTKGSASRRPQTLIVTESVFSMDGDHAPLRELVELKERYGAWLMVDEAHATGIYGPRRQGLAEELGVSDRVEIQMGTLGKALGTVGGFICGSSALVECLINRARSFIFSTAPAPALAAASMAAVTFVQSSAGESRRQKLWVRVKQLSEAATRWLPSAPGVPSGSGRNLSPAKLSARAQGNSAIIPIVIGDESEAMKLSAALRAEGIYIPAVRYPAVGRGRARLRVTLTASHTAEDVSRLLQAAANLNFQI